MKESLRKLRQELRNRLWIKGQRRYVVVTLAFLVWMVFIDKYRISTKVALSQTIEKLEESKEFYDKEIIKAKSDRKDLELNKEKYAREKYLMHKDNEDVFVIEK